MRPRTTVCICQRGFSLVSAIFLLVVLAALGAAIAHISSAQHTSSALDLQGERAYQAARAGVEWGLYRQLINNSCQAGPIPFVPPASTLSAFTVSVTCTSTNFAATSTGIAAVRIQATACNKPVNGNCPGDAGGTYYVERQVQVDLGG